MTVIAYELRAFESPSAAPPMLFERERNDERLRRRNNDNAPDFRVDLHQIDLPPSRIGFQEESGERAHARANEVANGPVHKVAGCPHANGLGTGKGIWRLAGRIPGRMRLQKATRSPIYESMGIFTEQDRFDRSRIALSITAAASSFPTTAKRWPGRVEG